MFGLGGIFVEILEDVAFRAIPISRNDAYSMINQIKARKVLEGARGEAGVDKDKLVGLLLLVSSIVDAHPENSRTGFKSCDRLYRRVRGSRCTSYCC